MALMLFAVARTLMGEPIGAASVLALINPALPKSAVAPVNATATLRMVGIAFSLVCVSALSGLRRASGNLEGPLELVENSLRSGLVPQFREGKGPMRDTTALPGRRRWPSGSRRWSRQQVSKVLSPSDLARVRF
jgi:hypothetical protein